jgi:hypothetical protein
MDEQGLLDELQSSLEWLDSDGWWFDHPVGIWIRRIDDAALLVRVESEGRVLRLRCQIVEPTSADAFDDAWKRA